ncbi:hypothetical protein AVEN_199743-1 [Araneus ventricosus]|uniref:Uncharacterized protein n=1 Tax=Araneus ventricosus TaxID=182803 RepID=A0A4Y2SF66_ARAVE|nr:hypothetical protein AVEN_199743-1 [Araneus ventricosus]
MIKLGKIPEHLLKSATWTCRQNSTIEFVQRASFHSVSSDTGTQNLFGNSQLRRSDGCPFSVELRRDYPQTIPLIAKTVTGHKSTTYLKEDLIGRSHELGWKS